MKKVLPGQLILILVFLTMIVAPATLLFHEPGKILVDENRKAIDIPKLVRDDGTLVTRSRLETYAKDNIGFREFAPRVDSMIMWNIFGVVLDTAQLLGKDGNLFPGANRYNPQLRAPHLPFSEEILTENGMNLEAGAKYFKSIDVPFLFITIPDKEQVYPNLYPDYFVQRPYKNNLGLQVEWLLENTVVDAYDMTSAMRKKAEQSDEMIWYEAGDAAHWNYMGAWYGYLEIMERLKNYDSELKTLSIDDFDITISETGYSNISKTFYYKGLGNTYFEFDYKPGFSSEYIDYMDDPWMPRDLLYSVDFMEGGKYFHYYNSEGEGTLVFFGDSYINNFLMPYFGETFEHVYLFHMPTNFEIMRPILDMMGADYIVIEMVERMYLPQKFHGMIEQFEADVPVLPRPEIYFDENK